MSEYSRKSNTTSILDFLFIVLFSFIILYMLSVPRTIVKKHEIVEKAEFLIEVSWDDDSQDDVDTFFVSPIGEKVWYRQQKNGVYNLDRDDLGTNSDEIVLPNGEKKTIKINREVLTMRGYISGLYRLNVFMFAKRDPTPTTVTVKIIKLNPYKIVYETSFEMHKTGDEKTVANFTLDDDGNVIDLNDNHFSMESMFPILERGGI